MSSCDPSNQVPFSGAAPAAEAAKKAWEARKKRGETFITLQDFIDFLHTGFDDMFEIAAVPEAVMARMRQTIDAQRPASVAVEGPKVVEGDIHLTLTMAPSGTQVNPVHRTTIIVRPEGTHDTWDADEVSRR